MDGKTDFNLKHISPIKLPSSAVYIIVDFICRAFEDVLPYFKKIENFTVPEYQDPSYHGKDGCLTISYAPYKTKIADAIIEASQQYGIKKVDYNGPTQVCKTDKQKILQKT